MQGRLSQRSWDQDGQKRSKVEVVASDVTFLDGGGGGTGGGDTSTRSSAPRKSSGKAADDVVEDIEDKPIDLSEIPF